MDDLSESAVRGGQSGAERPLRHYQKRTKILRLEKYDPSWVDSFFRYGLGSSFSLIKANKIAAALSTRTEQGSFP